MVIKWLDEHQGKCVQQQAIKKAEKKKKTWWTQKRKTSALSGIKVLPTTVDT